MLKKIRLFFFLVAILFFATFTFAEDAPVYDADNFPPQFDNPGDSSLDSSLIQQPAPSSSASYGFSDEQPVRKGGVEQRLSRIERQVSTIQRADLTSKMDSLQSDVQTLRGQVEELKHQLETADAQQKKLFSDLNKKINKTKLEKSSASIVTDDNTATPASSNTEIEALRAEIAELKHQMKPPAKSAQVAETDEPSAVIEKSDRSRKLKSKPTIASSNSETGASNHDQPNGAEEQQIYQTAYDLIKEKKYNEAISALQKMLQKYPTGQFAANAHYWLGELYNLLGKNDQSASEFTYVVKNFPESPKVSDAQLKLGLIYTAEFKWPEAKSAFKKVINHYPGTSSARLAAEQIKQIKEAGH